jgi:hypothetical protein
MEAAHLKVAYMKLLISSLGDSIIFYEMRPTFLNCSGWRPRAARHTAVEGYHMEAEGYKTFWNILINKNGNYKFYWRYIIVSFILLGMKTI